MTEKIAKPFEEPMYIAYAWFLCRLFFQRNNNQTSGRRSEEWEIGSFTRIRSNAVGKVTNCRCGCASSKNARSRHAMCHGDTVTESL